MLAIGIISTWYSVRLVLERIHSRHLQLGSSIEHPSHINPRAANTNWYVQTTFVTGIRLKIESVVLPVVERQRLTYE